jgi:hypothetical protein
VGDNIKLNLKETGYEGMEWIYLAQDRKQWWAVVNTAVEVIDPV